MWNSKPKKRGCDCRGRTHGRPKIGCGVCYGYGSQRPAVRQRILGRRAERAWLAALRGGSDPDDVG